MTHNSSRSHTVKLTKKRLVERLKALALDRDYEKSHGDADNLLLEYIGDPEIKAAYEEITRYCA